ncbi:hypothetical protein RFI_05620, partial [Reticulomyxa filosa]
NDNNNKKSQSKHATILPGNFDTVEKQEAMSQLSSVHISKVEFSKTEYLDSESVTQRPIHFAFLQEASTQVPQSMTKDNEDEDTHHGKEESTKEQREQSHTSYGSDIDANGNTDHDADNDDNDNENENDENENDNDNDNGDWFQWENKHQYNNIGNDNDNGNGSEEDFVSTMDMDADMNEMDQANASGIDSNEDQNEDEQTKEMSQTQSLDTIGTATKANMRGGMEYDEKDGDLEAGGVTEGEDNDDGLERKKSEPGKAKYKNKKQLELMNKQNNLTVDKGMTRLKKPHSKKQTKSKSITNSGIVSDQKETYYPDTSVSRDQSDASQINNKQPYKQNQSNPKQQITTQDRDSRNTQQTLYTKKSTHDETWENLDEQQRMKILLKLYHTPNVSNDLSLRWNWNEVTLRPNRNISKKKKAQIFFFL